MCFEMGFGDETKAGKARALVQYVEANERVGELKQLMRGQLQ